MPHRIALKIAVHATKHSSLSPIIDRSALSYEIASNTTFVIRIIEETAYADLPYCWAHQMARTIIIVSDQMRCNSNIKRSRYGFCYDPDARTLNAINARTAVFVGPLKKQITCGLSSGRIEL